MPVLESGLWVPELFPKQIDVFNSRSRILLVSGPRHSGKTWGVVHKVCRHLWETPGARVAMFSKTIKSAKDGGVWEDLVGFAIPEWIAANLESAVVPGVTFDYTVPPKLDGQTRTLYFRVRNMWGSESELKLFSLDYDGEVEVKVKGTRFSMIWFSELTNFEDRKVLVTTKQQLRMPHLRPDQHQWIADTNPGEDGPDSWIYKLWYQEKDMEISASMTDEEKLTFSEFQKQLGLIEIMLDDNPYLSEEKKREIKGDYSYDKDLYARYVEGKWVTGATKGRHFGDVFRESLHVVGDASALDDDDWEVALPSDSCYELICGWDLGDANHAAVIMEKITVGNKIHWLVLDELVIVRGQTSIEEFTLAFMEKMRTIEAMAGKTFHWRHWADESAMRYRSVVDDMDASVVMRASGGEIILEPVPKRPEDVKRRVHMMRRIIFEDRIKISANCKDVIQMFKKLRQGKTKAEYVSQDDHKHPFDALSYAVLMESAWDEQAVLPSVIKTKKRESDIVSMDLV